MTHCEGMQRRAMSAVVLLALTACVAESPSQGPPTSESPSPTVGELSSPSATTTAAPSPPTIEPDFPPATMVRAVLPGSALRGDPALSEERLGGLPEGS